MFPSQALAPPVASGGGARDIRLEAPADLRSVDGTVLDRGRLRLVVPASTSTLREWGRRLTNCLGSFDGAAERDRSQIIGVEVDDVLTYVLELTPERRVRQFLAARNRPVPHAHATTVLEHLRTTGVLID